MIMRENECEALLLLKKHFPRFGRLEKSEQPDWVDYEKSVGVEVTQAVNQTVKEQEEYLKTLPQEALEEIRFQIQMYKDAREYYRRYIFRG